MDQSEATKTLEQRVEELERRADEADKLLQRFFEGFTSACSTSRGTPQS